MNICNNLIHLSNISSKIEESGHITQQPLHKMPAAGATQALRIAAER